MEYIVRRIDTAAFELLPDGSLLIWEAGERTPTTIPPATVYALYLLMRLPGVAPTLRKLDDARQRSAWEARQGG